MILDQKVSYEPTEFSKKTAIVGVEDCCKSGSETQDECREFLQGVLSKVSPSTGDDKAADLVAVTVGNNSNTDFEETVVAGVSGESNLLQEVI